VICPALRAGRLGYTQKDEDEDEDEDEDVWELCSSRRRIATSADGVDQNLL
jgi:hypothetical protein